MKRKANRRQRTPGLRWSIQTQQPSIFGATSMWRRWALTAHPTRFAVLGLSLLICTGWLIGLRNAGSRPVVMESTSVYWIPIFELLDERGFR